MLRSVRITIGFLSPGERAGYFAIIAVRALSGLLDVAGIALIGVVAGLAATQFQGGSAGPVEVAGFTLPEVDSRGLFLMVLAVLGLFVLKAVIAVLLVRGQAFFVAGVEERNAARIARFLLTSTLATAKGYSKADFQFALTGSTTYAFTGILNNVATLFSEGFLLVVITGTFFAVNPIAALLTLAYFALVVLLIQLLIGRSLRRAGREAVEGTIGTTNLLSDIMDTFREISVLQKQDEFRSRVVASRRRISRSGATLTFLGGMPRYVVETSLMLGVVILVAQQFFTGQLASGIVTVGVFLTGGVRMMASVLPLQNALGTIKQNVEQAQVALRLLARDRDEAVAPAEPVEPPAGDRGLPVRVSALRYRHPGDARDTLRGISMRVDAGSHVAIVGPSGAGKSTLVDLILGLSHPRSGSVRVGGLEPAALRAARPGAIAYVPQRPGLVSGTIAENIALGVPPDLVDHDRLTAVVAAAHLDEFVASLPGGLDSSVGKQVDALSGGQVQRIGVARALYPQPRLLVLDEATSGLDAASEAFVSASLRGLGDSVTVVVIAHRLSTVQHADVVHVLEDGRITASGTFREVKSAVPMIAEYVRLMSFDEEEA